MVLPAGAFVFRVTVSNGLRVGTTVAAGAVTVTAAPAAESPECAVLDAVRVRLAAAEAQSNGAAVMSLTASLGMMLNQGAAGDSTESDQLSGCSAAADELYPAAPALVAGRDKRVALRTALRWRLLRTLADRISDNAFPYSADGAGRLVRLLSGCSLYAWLTARECACRRLC